MNDRELLELAAKAAGIEWPQKISGFEMQYEGRRAWNPLTDDGDALRLAVGLRMMLDDITKGYMAGHIVSVAVGEQGAHSCYEPREPDPYAATRRAIVRAAAEIGRNMP